MKFDVKCVRNYLIKHKVVFTVRRGGRYSGEVYVKDIGICYKKYVRKINDIHDIKRYVKWSGFDSVEDWWSKIKMFNACAGYLYRVNVVNEK